MSERNKLEVKIQGRQYTIVANEPDEYIYKIASYVDKKISEVCEMNARLSTDMASVLAAINIADENFKAQQSEDNLRRQVLEYVDEAKKADERYRALELENRELALKLKEKEDELSKFMKQF